MTWRNRNRPKVFHRGTSLRRRVAYSLAIVRLILVPVILLAVYYLFSMGWIVDQIVSVDAAVAMQAERVSVEMLNARRSERNYFLLHDPGDLKSSRQSLDQISQTLKTCRTLQPKETKTIDTMLQQVNLYRSRLDEAVQHMHHPDNQAPAARIREVILAYERDLDSLLRHSRHKTRSQLVEELQNRLGSLDAQVAETLVAEDPAFRQITTDLQTSSSKVLKLAASLESRSWGRVEQDHQHARKLVHRAEWVLGIVSALVILLSIWVSFFLPREVVRPLSELKAAVDHAAAGNYEIEFDVQGKGEVVELANSVRNLITHVRDKKSNSKLTPAS